MSLCCYYRVYKRKESIVIVSLTSTQHLCFVCVVQFFYFYLLLFCNAHIGHTCSIKIYFWLLPRVPWQLEPPLEVIPDVTGPSNSTPTFTAVDAKFFHHIAGTYFLLHSHMHLLSENDCLLLLCMCTEWLRKDKHPLRSNYDEIIVGNKR